MIVHRICSQIYQIMGETETKKATQYRFEGERIMKRSGILSRNEAHNYGRIYSISPSYVREMERYWMVFENAIESNLL